MDSDSEREKTRSIFVCNKDKVNAANLKCKWGEDELPIPDQYTYLGVEISQGCSWNAHTAKVIGKGNSHVGKMDAIRTYPHLDTRIKRCILIHVIVPKLEYAGEVWDGNAKFVKQLETVQMTTARNILGCSSTTGNTVFKSELGMYPLKTNRDVRKLITFLLLYCLSYLSIIFNSTRYIFSCCHLQCFQLFYKLRVSFPYFSCILQLWYYHINQNTSFNPSVKVRVCQDRIHLAYL